MRLIPALAPRLVALVTMTFASSALAAEPAAATKSPAPVDPARPGVAQQRTNGITFALEDETLLLTDTAASKTFRLHPIAAAVYLLADGTRSLSSLRAEAEAASGLPVDDETLFAALDALADAKLLVARVSPPGSTELAAFVTVDGVSGTDLVTATTSGGTASPTVADARQREERAKSGHIRVRREEAEQKKARPELRLAAEERAKAVGQLRVEASKEEVAKKAKTATASDEAALRTARARAEQSAKSELKRRKANEQEKKKDQQVKASER